MSESSPGPKHPDACDACRPGFACWYVGPSECATATEAPSHVAVAAEPVAEGLQMVGPGPGIPEPMIRIKGTLSFKRANGVIEHVSGEGVVPLSRLTGETE